MHTVRIHRWEVGALGVACLALLGLYLPVLAPVLGSYAGDNAIYLSLADSLVSGQGYRDLYQPPATPGGPAPLHVHYPPLFPTFLTPVVGLFGHNFRALHAALLAMAVLSWPLIYVFLRRHIGPVCAGAVTLAWGATPLAYNFTLELLSEIPYLVVAGAALLLTDMIHAGERRRWRDYVALGCLLGAAMLTRTQGLTLLPAVACALLIPTPGRRARPSLGPRTSRVIVAVLVACLIAGAWLVRNRIARYDPGNSGGGYTSQFFVQDPYHPDRGRATLTDFGIRVKRAVNSHSLNIERLLIGDALAPWPSSAQWIAYLISLLVIIGWALSLRLRRSVLEWYVLFYVLILLVWPWRASRFLVPLGPFLLLYLVTALVGGARLVIRDGVATHAARRLAPAGYVALALAAVLIAVNLVRLAPVQHIQRNGFVFPPRSSIFVTSGQLHPHDFSYMATETILTWLKYPAAMKNLWAWTLFANINREAKLRTPPDAVLLSRKPSITWYLTGRRSVGGPLSEQQRDILEHLDRRQVTHVIVDSMQVDVYERIEPLVVDYPRLFRVLHGFDPLRALPKTGLRLPTLLLELDREELRRILERTPSPDSTAPPTSSNSGPAQ